MTDGGGAMAVASPEVARAAVEVVDVAEDMIRV
jgi:hypothetical protein